MAKACRLRVEKVLVFELCLQQVSEALVEYVRARTTEEIRTGVGEWRVHADSRDGRLVGAEVCFHPFLQMEPCEGQDEDRGGDQGDAVVHPGR